MNKDKLIRVRVETHIYQALQKIAAKKKKKFSEYLRSVFEKEVNN